MYMDKMQQTTQLNGTVQLAYNDDNKLHFHFRNIYKINVYHHVYVKCLINYKLQPNPL